ncbi:hypothetical protein ABT224_16010 [Streptomyces sp. NPDC001584]|uniref:hypothetical protein n=1 Tax=Streptomyces sp. NPDC001584 TaxID=3154521 RepID=UPI003331E568
MTVDEPAAGGQGAEVPPIPWFGPTLYELVDGIVPGTRLPALRRQAGRARTEARQDPVRLELIRRADRASDSAVAALVAEMLAPPLHRHEPKEVP